MRLLASRGLPGELTLATGLLSTALLAMARFYPFDRFPLVVCPLRRLAGIPCPACGMTRAFVDLAHGRVGPAFRVSPLGALLAVAAIALALQLAVRLATGRGFVLELAPREKQRAALALFAALAANWAYLLVTRAAG